MKIVIDIDKEDWKDINDIHFIREDLKFKIGKAIMNGTPLPDGAEILTIDKRTFKAVTGRFVIYDREWLKEHFSTTEAYLYGGTRAAEQPEKRTEERTKTHACDYLVYFIIAFRQTGVIQGSAQNACKNGENWQWWPMFMTGKFHGD